MHVVLPGFSVLFVQTKSLCRYGCMYFLALVLVCVDVMVMSSA